MYRIYYWFLGTPADRPGGPWWYRDFSSLWQRIEFLEALKPRLHAYALTNESEPQAIDSISPPWGQIVFPANGGGTDQNNFVNLS